MYSIIDFETVGKNPNVCEPLTCYVVNTDKAFNVISEQFFQFKPETWDEESEEIHGIQRQTASTFPPWERSFRELIRFIPTGNVICCHANFSVYGSSSYFDIAILKMQLLRLSNYQDHTYFYKKFSGWLSTHTIFNYLQKNKIVKLDQIGKSLLSLDNLCQNFNIELLHHDAKSDCVATLELLKIAKSTIERQSSFFEKVEIYDFIRNPCNSFTVVGYDSE
jgi:DNA polymerase III epsilon subunit-like protein